MAPLAVIAALVAPAVPAGASEPGPVSIPLQSAPADPTFNDVITVSGTLIFGDGEPVAAPTELAVSRSRRDVTSSPVALPSVTTEADGTFAFTDLPGAGPWKYEVTYAGTAEHTRKTGTINVDVRRFRVEVSAELAPGQTVRWGQYARYVGRVTATEGPAISTPLTIGAATSGTCGGSGDHVQVQSTADGTFAFDARPACVHDSTLTVGSGSDREHEPGNAPALSSAVDKGSPVIQFDPNTAAHPVVTWGTPTEVGASVPFWATGPGLLEIFAQPYGQPKVRLKWMRLTNGDGPTSVIYRPGRRTVITAVYHGDDGLLPGSRSMLLPVRPRLDLTISGHDALVNGWRVFRHRTDRPHIGADSDPAHPGQRLKLVIQKRVNDTWRTVVSRSLRQDRAGSIETGFRGLQGAGNKYRVRASWAGDVDHVAATSYWRYFRFTR